MQACPICPQWAGTGQAELVATTSHALVITTTTSRTTVDGSCPCGWWARGTEEKVTQAYEKHLWEGWQEA